MSSSSSAAPHAAALVTPAAAPAHSSSVQPSPASPQRPSQAHRPQNAMSPAPSVRSSGGSSHQSSQHPSSSSQEQRNIRYPEQQEREREREQEEKTPAQRAVALIKKADKQYEAGLNALCLEWVGDVYYALTDYNFSLYVRVYFTFLVTIFSSFSLSLSNHTHTQGHARD